MGMFFKSDFLRCSSVAAQSDRLTSLFILPLLRLWIMAIIAECLFNSSSFCFSFVSSWLFCSSRDDAWKTENVLHQETSLGLSPVCCLIIDLNCDKLGFVCGQKLRDRLQESVFDSVSRLDGYKLFNFGIIFFKRSESKRLFYFILLRLLSCQKGVSLYVNLDILFSLFGGF